jgi:hypothetical protein
METKTLEALRESIQKWESRANGNFLAPSPSHCPLCTLFYFDAYCKGCPVMERTGKDCCLGTPCETYQDAADSEGMHLLISAAQEEVLFLKSLLPKDASK